MKINNFISGKFEDSSSYIPNIEPATGETYSEIADSSEAEINKAVKASFAAFPKWAATPEAERAKILRKIASLIEERLEEFSEAESRDNGKPVSLAKRVDIPRAAKNFSFFADAITQYSSESHLGSEPRAIHYTLRQPLGVVACISPWNLPLYLLSWKIAPALAAGNTVVAKPSEVTPLTAFLLSSIVKEAGLPDGVLNIVHGRGATAGGALIAHKDIKAISFTGSTKTGGEIAKVAAPQFKKLSLEMGGKNPTIVFANSDFDKAVEDTLRGAYTNQGEICLCGSRILVEKSIFPKFKDALLTKVKSLRVGDPKEEGTDQGALVSKEHFEKVVSAVETAKKEGGKVLCGGTTVKLDGRCKGGYFYAPTLIEGLDGSCATNQEEIFGPVATLIPFDNEDEAISLANGTQYGLSASVWTSNVAQAHRVSHALQCGLVWVNCWLVRDLRVPFGGVKQSGIGREGGKDALRFFTEPKSVCVVY